MILYIENPKKSTKKLLEHIIKLKISGYTINIQKSIYFYILAMENINIKFLKIPFTIASKRIKYLRKNFTKEV